MKLSAIVLRLAPLGFVALSGCATSTSKDEKNLEARWATDKFEVSFTSGPDAPGGSRKTLSYYRVRSRGNPQDQLIVPSGQSTSGLRSVTDSNPKSHIRLIEDPANSHLLIEENVINDCAPCTNYAIIEPDPDYQPRLRYRFVTFPPKPMGNAMARGAFGSQCASVTAIRGNIIEYKYGNLPAEQCEISSLPSSDEPTSPG